MKKLVILDRLFCCLFKHRVISRAVVFAQVFNSAGNMLYFKFISYAEASERKIIAHGIMGGNFSKTVRNFKGRLQVSLLAAGKPQRPADGVHVRIKGDDQQRRSNALPSARINIVTAHHPPQQQIQPLAGASAHRRRQRVEIKPA